MKIKISFEFDSSNVPAVSTFEDLPSAIEHLQNIDGAIDDLGQFKRDASVAELKIISDAYAEEVLKMQREHEESSNTEVLPARNA